ncbi:Polysaccharide pyruvyl transferase [Azotobacter beijerinckii]|uniref:Polysaccharide pyruvyl transferase n=1 Tax=Azotobacter beijerinckii TaxID=170623 RepID=A0A1H6WJM1_9GAMM|nr:polysaccharide pyruvyl transferase family protein [Azotobacter beijerinckii]SEJ14317.1 Polysaccharide pyruvyl transferase [Azotobacter beijerinckii]SEJ34720.1 Polysaccharide pyruvyl transferase [Azotobacter beijerinckii]
MKPFLLGFPPTIENSALLPTETTYKMVGDNTGNLAFCHAISQALGVELNSILWHAPAPQIDSMGDIGVITMANQLGPHADLGWAAKPLQDVKCKLVGIGLGAQAGNSQEELEIPEGTLDWIRNIQERAPGSHPNIAMRGEFSQRALERYGLADRTVVLGCPTLFISPEKRLGKTIAARFNENPLPSNVAITAGHQLWTHLSTLENSLVKIASSTGGAYICQSPLEMVMLGRGEASLLSIESRNACRNYIAPYMSDDEFVRWSIRHAHSFFSASAWMEYLRRFDFVIGTRIHGVMLALQVGVPAVCLAHDSRTVELCQTMLVPYVRAQDIASRLTRDTLPSLFNFDPDLFDQNRIKLAKAYVSFLQNNKLIPAPYLKHLTE